MVVSTTGVARLHDRAHPGDRGVKQWGAMGPPENSSRKGYGMDRARRGLLAFFVTVLIAIGAVGGNAYAEKVLNVAFYLDYHTWGPPFYTAPPDWPTNASVYNHLVRFVPGQADLEPDLAERWELSDDGLTFTFHLRQGVQFHHGYGEVTSEDIAFVYTQMQDPAIGENFAARAREIREIEVVDRYTIKFHMVAPQPDFIAAVVAYPGFIYSKRAFEELGVEGMRERPVGTGAYTLESWRRGEEIVLVANDSYFRGRPAIDRVVIKIIPEESVIVLGMRRGTIDYTILRQPDAIALAQMSPEIVVEATPILGNRSMWLNMNLEPFNDVRVRQALAYAVDRETLTSTVLLGQATTDGMWSPIPPGVFGHDPSVNEYHYNPERARALLAEAGYGSGITFDIQHRSPDRAVVQALQAMFAQVGVTANLVEVDAAQFFELTQTGNWTTSISGPSRTVPDAFLAFYRSSNRPNYYGLLDAEIAAQSGETDPVKRAEMLSAIQQRITADVPNIPLFRPLYVTASRVGVTGDVANSHYWLWYFEVMDKQ